MVDMQEAQLIVFLSQDKEEGVAKLQKFAKVIPPYGVCDLTKNL